jgi:hypothetical protein
MVVLPARQSGGGGWRLRGRDGVQLERGGSYGRGCPGRPERLAGLLREAEQYRELDDECVLVLVDWRGRGKTSGLELGQMRAKGADVVHVRAGKVTRLVTYRDRALADLGLAPETGFPDG